MAGVAADRPMRAVQGKMCQIVLRRGERRTIEGLIVVTRVAVRLSKGAVRKLVVVRIAMTIATTGRRPAKNAHHFWLFGFARDHSAAERRHFVALITLQFGMGAVQRKVCFFVVGEIE
jgi:hypothetical protein